MQKIFENAGRVIVYLTFFVPLVVVPSSFIFPFIVPKILLFRSLVLLLLGCYALLLYTNWRAYRPRMSGVAVALLVFLASFALSTFFGVDAYHSFWDNHERMLGLFTITHYVLYFFLCSALFKTWDDWKWALRLFLLADGIVMFIGVLQKWNPELLLNQGSDRVASTLGNAIYVGGYGLFLCFASVLLVMKEKYLPWAVLEGVFGLLGFLGLLFSGTRGSLVGLIAGILVAMAGYALFLKHHASARKILVALLAIFVVVGGILFVYRDTPAVRNIPAVGRLLNTSLGGTLTTRGIAWGIAIDGWKDRPIFGWGPNNFFYAFNAHYNPRSLEFGYGETWFDNAHNILLNTLAVQGIMGLLSYLLLFGTAIVCLVQAYRRGAVDAHLTVIGISFLVAHLVQNIAVFENPTSYLYFMFWLALIYRVTAGKGEEEAGKSKTVGIGMMSGTGLLVLLLIFVFNIQPARANMKTLGAMIELTRNPATGLSAVQEALSFDSPHVDDIRSDLTRTMVDLVGGTYQQLGKESSNAILSTGVEALLKNLSLHPRDIRLYISLAQISQLQFMVNATPQFIVNAERHLEQALTYSPRRQQIVYMLSTMKAQLGKKDEAIALVQRALNDNPKIEESYWRLAYLYYLFNENKKAEDMLALAKERGITLSSQGQQALTFITSRPKASGTAPSSP